MEKPRRSRTSLPAKKSLGQNFLISPRIVESIVRAGELTEKEVVLEVGPGKGVLTRALINAGALVKAVEKDNRLVPHLTQEFRKEIEEGKLELFHRDILEIKDEEVATIVGQTYKVIANIPYYITGALMRNLLSASCRPSMMVIMVQKEVATRIMARDGKESILSIATKAYAEPELVMNVSRGNFFPIPNVDSAVLKLKNIRNPFLTKEEEVRFFEFVKSGFAQKRKKLISNLEAVLDKELLEEKFKKLNLSTNTRAEELGVDVWMKLARD